jgi:hypothetical protein
MQLRLYMKTIKSFEGVWGNFFKNFPKTHKEKRISKSGTYRITDTEASAEDQLQGMWIQHLPGLRHETGGEESRPFPLSLRFG